MTQGHRASASRGAAVQWCVPKQVKHRLSGVPSQAKKFHHQPRRRANRKPNWDQQTDERKRVKRNPKPETELRPADRRTETCQAEPETECIPEDGRPLACAQQSFSPREVKAPLHMRGGTSFKETKRLKTVTSAAASPHVPGAPAKGPGCVDPAACNSARCGLVQLPAPVSNPSLSSPSTSSTASLHQFEPPRRESPLLDASICAAAMAVACPPLLICCMQSLRPWPRGQNRWRRPKNRRMQYLNVCKQFSTVKSWKHLACAHHWPQSCKYCNRGMFRADFLIKHGLPYGFIFLFFTSVLFKKSGGVHRLAHEAHTRALCFNSSNSSPLTPGSPKKR